MWEDFKEFISRGNVVDLAVGVIIGTAFTAIVSSLVDDIFMPIIGVILGGTNISGLAITVGEASINYGSFIMAIINFLLIALILFFFIRSIAAFNRALKEEEQAAEKAAPEPSAEEQLLTEIRDLLQKNLQTGKSGDRPAVTK